jgi:hypothetical protein
VTSASESARDPSAVAAKAVFRVIPVAIVEGCWRCASATL